ncbi:hypothetical protein [Streptomyces phaeochromogenes]|uniref:hypothetical protein n=1 Tax=Streptomyces phaeochromogenes TaxID=1923 RepID=UPI00386AE02F|nr:hypothetical protein OG277_38270 [Streptomyces phaeochromogenes]
MADELEAGQVGEAVMEWLHGRQLLFGLSVIETLRDRRYPPSKGAVSALMLLFQCQMLVMLDGLGAGLPAAGPSDPKGAAAAYP